MRHDVRATRRLALLIALTIGACSSSDQKPQQAAPAPEEKVAVSTSALSANGAACTLGDGSECTSGYCDTATKTCQGCGGAAPSCLATTPGDYNCPATKYCGGLATCSNGTCGTCTTRTAVGAAASREAQCVINAYTNPTTICSTTANCTTCSGTTQACDDGDACKTGDKCNGTTCQAGTTNAAAGTACTPDSDINTYDKCNGAGSCIHGCLISGTIYASGTVNPGNACQVCTPATSNTAWSNATSGTSCNDGNACTYNDVCNGSGTCGGTTITCTSTTCQTKTCNGTSSCTISNASSGTSCDDGNACTTSDQCNGSGTCAGSALCQTNTGTTSNSCSAGTCTPTCAANYLNCDGNGPNGCETNIKTSRTNCNACGVSCSATQSCVAGSCVACAAGTLDCNNDSANGCEQTNTDASCGCLGVACTTPGNACDTTNGSCTACTAPQKNCSGSTDGCETNTNTSTSNCGACGTVCSSANIASPTCSGGVCNGTCNSGFGDCNGNKQTDGCETNLNTSASNCSACGTVCSSTNIATPTCTAGACTGACNAGTADCNSNKQTDGCEVTLATNASNCGACGTVCSNNHIATPTCAASVCNGTCASGWGDCNSNKQTDGCETSLTASPNCGACGTTCQTNAGTTANTCSSGSCAPTCASGYADCNSNSADGCEKVINSDAQCGTGCTTVACSQNQTCSGGSCVACGTGTSDCNTQASDGCEKTDTSADCGCSHTNCSATGKTCSAGVCVSCAAGTLDCDGLSSNGCETGVNNVNSCGTTCGSVTNCNDGNACTVDTCSAGVCGHVNGNAGGVCRAAAGTCDVAEVCPAVTYEKTITIAGAQVSAALTNFPVLVRTTDADLMAHAASDGSDIYFTSNHTTVLDYEIERYDSSTGTLVAWVRIPSVATGSNTTFYMSYGAGGADQSNPTGVWDSSSKYVWHLAQDPGPGGSGDIKDSTGTHADATATAGMASTDLVDAVIGKGINFDGSTDQLSFTNSFTGTGSSTISAWVTQSTDTDNISDTIISFGNSTMNQHRFLYSQVYTTNNLMAGFYTNDLDFGTSIENQGWKHVAWTWDGSNSRIYVNGSLVSTMAHTGANTSGSAGLIGNATFAGRWLRGQLDEVRVDTTARSLAWIAASYNNQKSGATFISIGSQTGTGGTCPSDGFVSSGTVCRALVAGGCDIAAETCTGTSAACPADSVRPAGTQCRGVAGACDVAENCDGVSNTCPADGFAPTTTVCRSIASVCDLVAETCTGVGAACPADSGFAASTTPCRTSIGTCDATDYCTGSSGSCPADAYAPSTTVCRASVGLCDPAENCTGTSNTCPGDTISPVGTTCRSVAGACDVAETCTGGVNCPADTLVSSGTVCRPIASSCDLVAETCTGSTAACPADAGFAAAGTSCRAAAGTCDSAESCTGSSGSCPVDAFMSAGTSCRSSAGVCDVAETCSGSGAACPADGFVASGTVCRAKAGTCDSAAETCTGSSAACPADTSYASSSTVCRTQTGICDAPEFCTGSSTVCPGDGFAPLGSDCGYVNTAANDVTVYSTGLQSGTNANVVDIGPSPAGYTVSGSNPSAATLQSTLVTGWGSDAYKFATTAPAGAQYDYWRWVSGNGTASGSSRALQAADMIEYDVYVDSNIDGIGGIDIKTSHATGASTNCAAGCDYFRGYSDWSDQNGITGHPAGDIKAQAYGKWYHRRLPIPAAMPLSTITYFDVADENNSAGSRNAYYDNLVISQHAGACDGAGSCKIAENWGCAAGSDCASGICTVQTLDASMTHRWTFAGSGTTVTDTIAGSSGNGTVIQSTQSGGTVTLAGGVLSNSASAQYVDLADNILTTANVSIEVWFVWNNSTNAWQRVFDFGSASNDYVIFTPNNAASAARLEYLHGSTKYGVNTAALLPTGQLTQVVATYLDSSNTMTLFVNGTSIGSTTIGGTNFNTLTDTNNWLGRSEFTSSDYTLAGTIYDARIYNKALSAAEVLASYKRGTEYSVCFAPLSNGGSCSANNMCISGFCSDGVCCNNACGNGASGDCQACNVAGHAGTCWPVTTGTTCRPSAGTCDVAEVCDGSATTCPIDTQ